MAREREREQYLPLFFFASLLPRRRPLTISMRYYPVHPPTFAAINVWCISHHLCHAPLSHPMNKEVYPAIFYTHNYHLLIVGKVSLTTLTTLTAAPHIIGCLIIMPYKHKVSNHVTKFNSYGCPPMTHGIHLPSSVASLKSNQPTLRVTNCD